MGILEAIYLILSSIWNITVWLAENIGEITIGFLDILVYLNIIITVVALRTNVWILYKIAEWTYKAILLVVTWSYQLTVLTYNATLWLGWSVISWIWA